MNLRPKWSKDPLFDLKKISFKRFNERWKLNAGEIPFKRLEAVLGSAICGKRGPKEAEADLGSAICSKVTKNKAQTVE